MTMADNGHKHDFPDQADIADFLRQRWGTSSALVQALAREGIAIPPETARNWYRKRAGPMGAPSLLQVVLTLGIEESFGRWLKARGWLAKRRPVGLVLKRSVGRK